MMKLTGCIFLISFFLLTIPQQDVYREERQHMVEEQLAQRGIKDQATLQAMKAVPRHQFVASSRQEQAYSDGPLPIGHGQTISQPYIVAYMTELLRPGPDDVMLEVGTGSGYQAAVLSEIVKEVHTIEIIEALATSARQRLKDLNYDNVTVYHGDGYYGKEAEGPFDGIVVTAASEHIPPPLIEQLKDGGKMIIPVGSPFMTQQLVLVTKTGGKARTKNLIPVRFVPFTRETR